MAILLIKTIDFSKTKKMYEEPTFLREYKIVACFITYAIINTITSWNIVGFFVTPFLCLCKVIPQYQIINKNLKAYIENTIVL